MNAHECKKVADEYAEMAQEIYYNKLLEDISQAAHKGRYAVFVDILPLEIIKRLKGNGFIVSEAVGGGFWIRWREETEKGD